jgi:hypothetical protein
VAAAVGPQGGSAAGKEKRMETRTTASTGDRHLGGPLIAGVAGVLLFIFMFLNWFELTSVTAVVEGAEQTLSGEQLEAAVAEEEGLDTSVNAWDSFDLFDWLLVITAVAAVALAITAALGVQLPFPLAMIAAVLGVLSVLLILIRIISPPDLFEALGGEVPEEVDVESDVGRKIGVWLGLLAAIGVTIGAALSTVWWGRSQVGPRTREKVAARETPPPPPPSGTGTPPPPGP